MLSVDNLFRFFEQMSGNMENDLSAAAFELGKERIYPTKVLSWGYLTSPFASSVDKIVLYISSKGCISSSGLEEKSR